MMGRYEHGGHGGGRFGGRGEGGRYGDRRGRRGGWEGGRRNGRPIPPFGNQSRGGRRMPVGPNSQMFPFPMGGPNGFPDFHTTDPKVIRNEVIPQLVQMGQTGRANGTINEMQFNELMKQVTQINLNSRSILSFYFSFFTGYDIEGV